MNEREELEALRRLAELESRSRGTHAPAPQPEPNFVWGFPNSDPKKELERQMFLRDRVDYSPALDGMSTADTFVAGMGKAVGDQKEGFKQLAGANASDYADAKRRDAPLMRQPAAQWGHLAGSAGIALLPAGLLRGAALPMRAAGGTPGMQSQITALSNELAAPNTITGGLVQGGAYGFTQPALNATDRQGNVMGGAAGAALVPAVTRGGSLVNSLTEPFHQAGRDRIINRLLDTVAGPDAAAMRARLRNPAQLVPGSNPTVAEVAQVPSIAALQRTATATDPAVTNALAARRSGNEAARIAELENMAGTGGARDQAATARRQQTGPLYEAAFAAGIDKSALTPDVRRQMQALIKNPFIRDLVPISQKLAKADGIKISKEGSLEGLHYLKLALDDQIERAASKDTKIGANELRKLRDAKESLANVLDSLSPQYSDAVRTYADLSKPLNRMDFVQTLLDRSRNPMQDMLYPQRFGANLSDDMVARTLGRSGATLENTMTPDQLARLTAIKQDLQRQQFADNAGRGVGSDTVQKLAYSGMAESAGVPSFIRSLGIGQVGGNLVGRGLDSVYGRANRELASFLAQVLQDPAVAQQVMFKPAPTALQKGLLKALRSGREMAGVAGLALPARSNAAE